MTDKPEWQKYVDEINAMHLKEETESDDCAINGFVIGSLDDLPLWAQGYIKYLRLAGRGKQIKEADNGG